MLTIRSAAVALLFAAACRLAFAADAADEPFAGVIVDEIGGRAERLTLTGTAVRTKFGIPLYRIAGYCDEDARPSDVDGLTNADVPKRLILVMQRDVADWILQKGFAEALEKNDPERRFAEPSKRLLDYLSATDHKEGTAVVLTHVPGVGLQCRAHDREPLLISDVAFAQLCWRMFLGPKPVSPEVRAGLGTLLR